ncbi:MAG: hypothetical protein K1X67_17945 [Fimbriimonadaceae bacterium]|nr:hypothetical protein [Fimbriimonadaceae bacterium]
MNNLLAIAFFAVTPASALEQIIFASDQVEPKLEILVFACETEASLSDLAKKQDLIVQVTDDVAFVCRKNVLHLEEAKERTALIKELTQSLGKPYELRDLAKGSPVEQARVRKMVAQGTIPTTTANMLLKSNRAPFTIEPKMTITLRKGDRRATVAWLGPTKGPDFDSLLSMLVEPEYNPNTPYPLGIEPAEYSPVPKRAQLKFSFGTTSDSPVDRLIYVKRFQETLQDWVAKADAAYEEAYAKFEPVLLKNYPDLNIKGDPKTLAELGSELCKVAERHLVDAYFYNFKSRGEAQAFLNGAEISSIEYSANLVFRIKDSYEVSADGRGRSMGLSTPFFALDNPLGK